MWIIGSPYGTSLIFKDADDLERVIKELSKLLEWTQTENIPAPHLYHEAEEHVPKDELDSWTDWLKRVFAEGNAGLQS